MINEVAVVVGAEGARQGPSIHHLSFFGAHVSLVYDHLHECAISRKGGVNKHLQGGRGAG